MRLPTAVFAAVLFLAGPAIAAPSAADLQAGLAGDWKGALGYRNYQDDKLMVCCDCAPERTASSIPELPESPVSM